MPDMVDVVSSRCKKSVKSDGGGFSVKRECALRHKGGAQWGRGRYEVVYGEDIMG